MPDLVNEGKNADENGCKKKIQKSNIILLNFVGSTNIAMQNVMCLRARIES